MKGRGKDGGREREGGEGRSGVRFISCALWLLMMVPSGVTVGSSDADFLKGEGQ